MLTLAFALGTIAVCLIVCCLDRFTGHALVVFQVVWTWALVASIAMAFSGIAPWPVVLVGALAPPLTAIAYGVAEMTFARRQP